MLEPIFTVGTEAEPPHLWQYIGHVAEISMEHQPTSIRLTTFKTLL